MRATESDQTGGAGVHEVMGNFERIGWGPVENPAPDDLGTDLWIQVRDDRRFERGVLLGAQSKAGPSYFASPITDDSGAIVGWWYDEPDVRHFDDWVRHTLPHLVVLHNLETRVSYWAHVTPDAVQITGKGAKIKVPAGQTVDLAHLDALLDVAASGRPSISLEGTAWTAGPEQLAPGDRLRHALIVPRLVAPHRNRGFSTAIEPEAAVALLAAGRVDDVEDAASQHATVPDFDAAASHKDWRWRIVAAVSDVVLGRSYSAMVDRIADAPNAASRAAAVVVTACSWMSDERHRDALALLTEHIDHDDLGPVDHAWLLVQRARVQVELGQVAEGRSDATAAQRALASDVDDVTASALASAAAWLLFYTADWHQAQLDEALTAGDNAVSWWRAQTVSAALTEAAMRAFRDWADERAIRWEAGDSVNNNLFSAVLTADLVGEHHIWRAGSSLLGRNSLVNGHARRDHTMMTTALDELRASGDQQSLALAARRMWSDGPLPPLGDAVGRVRAGRSTHTTAQTNLTLWAEAGDLLDGASADAAVDFILAALDEPSTFAAATTPSFEVDTLLCRALTGVLPAASDDTHKRVAAVIAAHDPIDDQASAQHYAQVVRVLRPDVLTGADRDALCEAGLAQPDRLLSATLLCAAGDRAARDELARRVVAGDMTALGAFGPVTDLPPEAAEAVIARMADAVDRVVAAARNRTWGLSEHDPVKALIVMGTCFPDLARWDPVVAFLNAPDVAGQHKRTACLALADRIAQLPADVTDQLRTISTKITITAPADMGFGRPLAGAPAVLAAALNTLDANAIAETFATLGRGSRYERRDAAFLAMHVPDGQLSAGLAVLASDPLPDVRSVAASALLARVANASGERDLIAVAALELAVTDPGARVPFTIAAKLTTLENPVERAKAFAFPLIGHRSALVRAKALKAIGADTQTRS